MAIFNKKLFDRGRTDDAFVWAAPDIGVDWDTRSVYIDSSTSREPVRVKRNFLREMLDEHVAKHGSMEVDFTSELFSQVFKQFKESQRMKLFEYAAFYIPTEKGEKAAIVVPPTTVLAKTEEVAKSLAARAIPAEYADNLDKVTVVVRPFI